MKHGITFALLSIGILAAIFLNESNWIAKVILVWLALSIGVIAIAYLAKCPSVFMKREEGTLPKITWLIFGPYFCINWILLLIYRFKNRRTVAFAEVESNLWFAQRLTAGEAKSANVKWNAVLDLAPEFACAPIGAKIYRSIPMLDGEPPKASALREAIAWIDEQLPNGPLLVHCALGHGRTGSVVLVWLLVNKRIDDAKMGVEKLRLLRPGFGISDAQLARVNELASE